MATEEAGDLSEFNVQEGAACFREEAGRFYLQKVTGGVQFEHLSAAHQLLFKKARRTEIDDVVLSGGSTMFVGLEPRLRKELTHLAPASIKVNIGALITH